MKTVLGIDPGLKGAYAIIGPHGVLVEPMPTVGDGKLLDLHAIASWFRAHSGEIDMAFLEQVSAMPKQGVSSTFKFGRVYGAIEGILAACGIPYTLVSPRRWCAEMHQGVEGAVDPKEKSRIAAKRLFPSVNLLASDLSRVPHSGMVDAVLIAAFGARQMNRKEH